VGGRRRRSPSHRHCMAAAYLVVYESSTASSGVRGDSGGRLHRCSDCPQCPHCVESTGDARSTSVYGLVPIVPTVPTKEMVLDDLVFLNGNGNPQEGQTATYAPTRPPRGNSPARLSTQ
jgi:hypothetical protein